MSGPESSQNSNKGRFPQSLTEIVDYVDVRGDTNLWMAVFFMAFTPFIWNVICRHEYKTKNFSRLFGSAKLACFTLSLFQIACSNTRNYFFHQTLHSQAQFETPFNDVLNMTGYFLMAIGAVLVVTAFYRLGWICTWHGDHFGIYLPAKVTGFPFNVVNHPMHVGAMLAYLGQAFIQRSIAGIVLTFWQRIVYYVTEMVEGPFTDMIYSRLAASKSKKN